MAEELIPHFEVAWNEADKPESGLKYLYFTPEVNKKFADRKTKAVLTERVVEEGEERYKITTIIEQEDGLGVECLRGSGLIAGATSRAYEDNVPDLEAGHDREVGHRLHQNYKI